MSSYSPTTLLPPSPLGVLPHDIPLPESMEKLIVMSSVIDRYLDQLWNNYVEYAEGVTKPQSTKVFSILFSEMDYFEVLKARITLKIIELTKVENPYA